MSGIPYVLDQTDEVDETMGVNRLCGAIFIDQHRDILIQRACTVVTILDKLLSVGVINNEEYHDIKNEKTDNKQMRALLTGPIRASGDRGKQILFKTLKEQQPLMMKDLGVA
ncbi:apoptosis-associated speck-like protein containing a CARD [Ictalurus furcatus]|uniref:apoptosis-associated speck-like protein containing a CARD n=1 Tax=Ictalurus furcatus TaxID=66913 RepID=UPI002350B695|nr:apoptosis-associated speck-like protein containing a CARD [Ictalurus furcatus]